MKKIIMTLAIMLSFNAFANHTILQKEEIKENGTSVLKEIFYYACNHCANVEPTLREFEKNNDIKVEKVPVVFSKKQELAAKHYYAAMYLKREKDFSKEYLKHFEKNKEVSDQLALSVFYKIGEKKDKVKEAFNSHWVKNKIKEAKKYTISLKITSIPTFVLNEKYLIKRNDFNNDLKMFNYIKSLSK